MIAMTMTPVLAMIMTVPVRRRFILPLWMMLRATAATEANVFPIWWH